MIKQFDEQESEEESEEGEDGKGGNDVKPATIVPQPPGSVKATPQVTSEVDGSKEDKDDDEDDESEEEEEEVESE